MPNPPTPGVRAPCRRVCKNFPPDADVALDGEIHAPCTRLQLQLKTVLLFWFFVLLQHKNVQKDASMSRCRRVICDRFLRMEANPELCHVSVFPVLGPLVVRGPQVEEKYLRAPNCLITRKT